MTQSWLKFLLKLAVSLLVGAWLLGQVPWASVVGALQTLSPKRVAAAMALFTGIQTLSAWRWYGLIRAGGLRVSFFQAWRWYAAAMFANLFLPGSIGGDGFRVFWLAQATGVPKRQASWPILLDRGTGLIALVWLATMAAWLWPVCFFVIKIGLSLASLVLAIGLLWFQRGGLLQGRFLPSSLVAKLDLTWREAATPYSQNKTTLAEALGYSLLVQAGMVGLYALLFKGFWLDLSPTLTVAVGLGSLAGVLPLSLNGLGVREGVMLLLLAKAGLPKAACLALNLAVLAVTTVVSLLAGIFWLALPKKPVATEESESFRL